MLRGKIGVFQPANCEFTGRLFATLRVRGDGSKSPPLPTDFQAQKVKMRDVPSRCEPRNWYNKKETENTRILKCYKKNVYPIGSMGMVYLNLPTFILEINQI